MLNLPQSTCGYPESPKKSKRVVKTHCCTQCLFGRPTNFQDKAMKMMMSALCQKRTQAPQQLTVISSPELATHFCFFKGNVDPIRSSEQSYGGTKHWPRTGPDCDAKGKNNEA